MKEYHELMERILAEGVKSDDRTGVGTISKFGEIVKYDLTKGFPAVTTKKLAWKAVVGELVWMLEGSTDERRLAELTYGKKREDLRNKTTIWSANRDVQAKALGYHVSDMIADLGPVYGNNWRFWKSDFCESITVPVYDHGVDKTTAFRINTFEGEKPPYHDRALEIWQGMDTMDYKWHDFRNFLVDLNTIPGFYDWAYGDEECVFTKDYTNSTVYTKGACAFVPKSAQDGMNKPISSGPVYRKKLFYDQVTSLVEDIKNNPNSRRHVLTTWNVPAIPSMTLPPCHMSAQFYVRDNKLSCMMTQRSGDVLLGVPFNIAFYSLLTHIIANEVGLGVGEFVHSLGDAHIYLNHLDQVKEQLGRVPYELPVLKIDPDFNLMKCLRDGFPLETAKMFTLENYKHYDAIKAPMAV